MANGAQSADAFLGSDNPAPSADAFLGPDPATAAPPPTQTLKGFGQAAGTVVPNSLIDIAGMPVDAVGNMFNLEQAAVGTAKGVFAGAAMPADEAPSPDGRAGITKGGLYHYRDGSGQEIYSKNPAPEGSHPVYLQNSVDLPQVQSTDELPGSSGQIRGMVRNLAGSNLVDIKERTALNRYTAAIGEGAVTGAIGGAAAIPGKVGTGALAVYDAANAGSEGMNTARYLLGGGAPTAAGTVARGVMAGATGGAVQEGAQGAGYDSGTGAALGFLAGAVAGARGPRRAAFTAPERGALVEPSTSEKLLDTPDVAHEGSGAEVAAAQPAKAPTPARASTDTTDMSLSPAERALERERQAALRDREEGQTQQFIPEMIPLNAATREGETAKRDAADRTNPPPAPQDGFMADLNAKTQPHPTEPAQRKLGPVSVAAAPDATDPNSVHIQRFAAEEPGKGSGNVAMNQLTALADQHGVNLTLDAKPEAGEKPIPQEKLDQFYQNHGFVPDEAGGGAMIRRNSAAEPGYEVQEGEPEAPPQLGSNDHPMRNGQPYTMISGELAGRPPAENAQRNQALGQMLRQSGYRAEPTMGAYQGTPERSWAVQAPSEVQRAKLENVGRVFGQEAVMHVDADRNATMKNLGGDQQAHLIGKMRPVDAEEAQASAGWTRDADGNHYTVKPDEQTNAAPESKNGMGAAPEKTPPKSLFGEPAKNGSMNAEPTAAGQADRVNTFRRVGLTEVRNSAINGDHEAAGTEFQTSKVKGNPAADRLAGVIDSEHQALRGHAEDAIGMTGGSKGMSQPELYSRGTKLAAPINDLHEHLDKTMNDAYEAAKIRAKGVPFQMNAFRTALGNEHEFESTMEGSQLLRGVKAAAKKFGFTGESDVFKPATVEQAERMRQYLNDAWTPRTNKLIGMLKGQLDQDVMRSAGQDLFEKGRNVRTLMSKILEEPDGVSKLLHTKEANKLGINKQVPTEDVPSYVTKLPFDQFRQYVSVLKQAAQAGVKSLRDSAVKAHDEVRAQFANEYHAAGDNQKGQWNQKGANKYLKDNEMAMRYVFSPEEMQHFVDNDNAGRWLSMDRSYPGAEAQKQSITNKLATIGAKHATEGAIAAGTLAGHIPGAIAGAAVGKLAGAGMERLAAKGAEKLITNLDTWKPEDTGATGVLPKGATIPGQRGAVGDLGKQSTAGSKNKQKGGSVGGQPKTTLPPEIEQNLTDQERRQLRADTTKRMIDAFHSLPDTHEYAAAALAGEAKKGWYRDSAKAIANVFGPDAPRFAATLAAMSPQTSVQSNFHNAIRTFINWDKAGRPQDPAKIKDIMQDSVQRQEGGTGVLHSWVPNTIRALTHPDPEKLPVPNLDPGKGDMLSFRHFSKTATGDKVMLDPSYYGSGVPGAEAKRIAAGAPKVTAAYASDHPDSQVERDVRQGATEYQVRVPRSKMYDLSQDPENIKGAVAAKDIRDGGAGVYNHSDAENMLKKKGYDGYYIPNGAGIMKGQARFFKPVEGVRAGSGATPSDLQPSMPGLQLSGPKVNSFMHNLTGNVNEVTNDAWMSMFSKIDPRTLGGKGSKVGPGKRPTYLASNAKARQAASMLTHLTGEKWTPAEVQETVWSFAKTAFEHAARTGRQVPDVVKNGEITDDLIRSTPDFHTLFGSDEHRGFIADSRYAENAQRLAGGQKQSANPTNSGKKSAAAKKALRPHLERASERLGETLQERRASGDEAPF